MPETVNAYSTAQPQPAYLQKVKATFSDTHGQTVHIEFNPVQQSLRIRLNAQQRLFFIEKSTLQKTLLRNEYGVIMGHLTAAKGNAGWVRLDGRQYQFAYFNAAGERSLFLEPGATLASHITVDSFLMENGDAALEQSLVHCLVFAYAWALNVPVPKD